MQNNVWLLKQADLSSKQINSKHCTLVSSIILDLKRKQWLSQKTPSQLHLNKPILLPYSQKYSTEQENGKNPLCLNGCIYSKIRARLTLENAKKSML